MGESFLASPESALGRVLRINLRELTGNVKDQNAFFEFIISKTQASNLHTVVRGYLLTPTYIKRMVRKDCNRLDDSFVTSLKDGRKIVVKTFALTIKKTHHSLHTKIRQQVHDFFHEEAAKSDLDSLVSNLTSMRIQSTLKKKLRKAYPLKEFSIRALRLLPARESATSQKEAPSVAESPGA